MDAVDEVVRCMSDAEKTSLTHDDLEPSDAHDEGNRLAYGK
jgi:hypothetical protein